MKARESYNNPNALATYVHVLQITKELNSQEIPVLIKLADYLEADAVIISALGIRLAHTNNEHFEGINDLAATDIAYDTQNIIKDK